MMDCVLSAKKCCTVDCGDLCQRSGFGTNHPPWKGRYGKKRQIHRCHNDYSLVSIGYGSHSCQRQESQRNIFPTSCPNRVKNRLWRKCHKCQRRSTLDQIKDLSGLHPASNSDHPDAFRKPTSRVSGSIWTLTVLPLDWQRSMTQQFSIKISINWEPQLWDDGAQSSSSWILRLQGWSIRHVEWWLLFQ